MGGEYGEEDEGTAAEPCDPTLGVIRFKARKLMGEPFCDRVPPTNPLVLGQSASLLTPHVMSALSMTTGQSCITITKRKPPADVVLLADAHDIAAEPSETGAADACRAMLCSSMPTPESPCPGGSPLREPEPAHMRLGSNPGLGPSFGLASPRALPYSAEPGSGSPVSEQTPLAGSPMRPAGVRAPMTARPPATKSRRRMLLCKPDVEPDSPGNAGQLAGHVLDSDAALSPWLAARQEGGWGGSAPSSPLQAARAWLTEDAEEDALRQTGLWSPGSPIAERSPGAGAPRAANPSPTGPAAPHPNQPPPAACTPAPVFTAGQPAAANLAGAPRVEHAAPAAARLQLTADVHANPFTGFVRVPSPVMRTPRAAGAASSGSSGAARRALDMSSVPAQEAFCSFAGNTSGLHARSCIPVPAKDGHGAAAASDLSPSAAAAAAADTRMPLACASQDPTSRPAKRRIKLPQCPLLLFLSAASSQQPRAPGSCPSAKPAAASEGAHAGMPAQQGPRLGDKQPHVLPVAEASKRTGVVGGLDAGRAAEVHGSMELAGCGAVGEAGGAASGRAASEEQVPAARQLDDLSSVFSFLL